jgi:hypothetical protein
MRYAESTGTEIQNLPRKPSVNPRILGELVTHEGVRPVCIGDINLTYDGSA